MLQRVSDLVTVLVCTSSVRRCGLVAERVDVDTDKQRLNSKRTHGNSPFGNAVTLDSYSQDVELLFLGTRTASRACTNCSSLGGCVTSQITTTKTGDETEQREWRRRERRPRESIASLNGAKNLVQALKRALGTQIIASAGGNGQVLPRRHRSYSVVQNTRPNEVTVSSRLRKTTNC